MKIFFVQDFIHMFIVSPNKGLLPAWTLVRGTPACRDDHWWKQSGTVVTDTQWKCQAFADLHLWSFTEGPGASSGERCFLSGVYLHVCCIRSSSFVIVLIQILFLTILAKHLYSCLGTNFVMQWAPHLQVLLFNSVAASVTDSWWCTNFISGSMTIFTDNVTHSLGHFWRWTGH